MIASCGTQSFTRILTCMLWVVACDMCPLQSQANTTHRASIDLRSGLLNGRPTTDWTLEQVTDSFGRPSAVSNGVADIIGPQLHYHARGLSFWFIPKAKDPDQHLWILTTYLAREWDGTHSASYEVFAGDVLPAVDANWKQTRLLSEFAGFKPEVKTAEDSKRALQATGMGRTGVSGPQTDFVTYFLGDLRVTFAIEPNTKFVERIVLADESKSHRR